MTDVPSTAAGQNCGVINPYALAEVVAGKKINWKAVAEPRKLLEKVLQTPYQELFDPVFEGPLYTGLALKDNKLERVRSPLLDIELRIDKSDLESNHNFEDVKYLKDLGQRFNVQSVADLAVYCINLYDRRYVTVKLALPHEEYLRQQLQVYTKDIVRTISYTEVNAGNANQDWTPPGANWMDKGRFFNEGTEYFDPVQGAVANCYFIAALSAVAWATPKQIRNITRATGSDQEAFTNIINFYLPDSNGALDKEMEVTDTVPVASWGGFIYARSSEDGEIWPAVYEKAFAKLKTGTLTDHPDISATAWGDCVWATAQLNGKSRNYYDTDSHSADDLWNYVRANSLSYKTFNPMTAWTFATGTYEERGINYTDANVVASHCYTILGWGYNRCGKYIILRNPWGVTDVTANTYNGDFYFYDISWWRPINTVANDGVFAIEASAFKRYFGGMGVAK